MVDKLTKQDITKSEAVYEQNYIAALNLLGYWKTLDNLKNDNTK
jgi:hypothetical protein